MITYFNEAKRHKNIRGFKYGAIYTLEEVAVKLGFTTEKRKILFFKTLIKHGIVDTNLEPSYLSFISGFIERRDHFLGDRIVNYAGTMMIGDLIEANKGLPPK